MGQMGVNYHPPEGQKTNSGLKEESMSTKVVSDAANSALDYEALVKKLTTRPVTVAAIADNTRGTNPVQFVFVALWEGATLVAPLFAVSPNDTIHPGQSKTVALSPNEWEITSYQYFWHEYYGGDWHIINGPKWTAPAGYFYTNAGIDWVPAQTVVKDGSVQLSSVAQSISTIKKRNR